MPDINQFALVAVKGDEHAFFVMRKLQDILIWNPRILLVNGEHIMPEFAQLAEVASGIFSLANNLMPQQEIGQRIARHAGRPR